MKYVYACKKDTITNFEIERKTKKTIEERGAFERKEETGKLVEWQEDGGIDHVQIFLSFCVREKEPSRRSAVDGLAVQLASIMATFDDDCSSPPSFFTSFLLRTLFIAALFSFPLVHQATSHLFVGRVGGDRCPSTGPLSLSLFIDKN